MSNWTRESAINWIHEEIKAGKLSGMKIAEAYKRAYKLPRGGTPIKKKEFTNPIGVVISSDKCRVCGDEIKTYPKQDPICSSCWVKEEFGEDYDWVTDKATKEWADDINQKISEMKKDGD